MPPPMITTRAWDGMLCTESSPAPRFPGSATVEGRLGGSVLRDRVAQYRAHQVDIGAAGDECRSDDRHITGGLPAQASIEQLRLQLAAARARRLAGFDFDPRQHAEPTHIADRRQGLQSEHGVQEGPRQFAALGEQLLALVYLERRE